MPSALSTAARGGALAQGGQPQPSTAGNIFRDPLNGSRPFQMFWGPDQLFLIQIRASPWMAGWGEVCHLLLSGAVFLKMRYPNWQPPHHLGTCEACKFSSPTPEQESENQEKEPFVFSQALRVVLGHVQG